MAALSSVVVTPSPASIPSGATQQFTATAVYTDSTTQNVTATASWTSSDTALATVSATGLATAVANGAVTITATYQGRSGSSILEIAVTLSSIAITPTSATILAGQTKQFKAVGTYSDGSTEDLTIPAPWTSNDTAIATVTSTGLATGVSAGSVVIDCQWEGRFATAALAVTAQVYDPCAALATAKAQLAKTVTGGAVRAVETPQLGRVEFANSPSGTADLMRLINALERECAAATGSTTRVPRGPISIEVDP